MHENLCIENFGLFSICIFSQKTISAEIYPNKVAAPEDYDTDILELKRLGAML